MTGKNYDKREQKIVDQMKWLTTVFGIELCAYVVMSNHYHVVLHVDSELIDNLSEKEVAERWTKVYKNSVGLSYVGGEKLEPKEMEALNTCLPIWRSRLKDISWYMRTLNEGIARNADKDDKVNAVGRENALGYKCSGRFWDRFLLPAKTAYITSL